jgi:hypothetical protein
MVLSPKMGYLKVVPLCHRLSNESAMAILVIGFEAKETRGRLERQGGCLLKRNLSRTGSEVRMVYSIESLEVTDTSCFATWLWISQRANMNILDPAAVHFVGQRLLGEAPLP